MRLHHCKHALPRLTVAAIVIGVSLSIAYAHDDDDDDGGKGRSYSTALSGHNEVHFSGGTPATLRGAISTRATGKVRLDIDERAEAIDYELSYEELEGAVRQAHIHFGQQHTVGGIVVWLCQTAANPAPAAVAAETPTCPESGTVTGTIRPSQVIAQTAQGIGTGDFDKVVRAIRAGAAYVNVHTDLFPPGEIRGQLGKGGGHR